MTVILFAFIFGISALFMVIYGWAAFIAVRRESPPNIQRMGIVVSILWILGGSISILGDRDWIAIPMVLGASGIAGAFVMWWQRRKQIEFPMPRSVISALKK